MTSCAIIPQTVLHEIRLTLYGQREPLHVEVFPAMPCRGVLLLVLLSLMPTVVVR